ncbi:MAG: flagellar basal body-associated FliL family protein [Oscillospiraceae bacterium]|nr:flagellar basal body-associated FliL family protein [Oscillospiraceae bacterium]
MTLAVLAVLVIICTLAACSQPIAYPGSDLLVYEVTEPGETMRINVRDSDKAYTLTGVVVEFNDKQMGQIFEEKSHYIKDIVTDYLRLKTLGELANEPTERFSQDIAALINARFQISSVQNVNLPGFVVYQ